MISASSEKQSPGSANFSVVGEQRATEQLEGREQKVIREEYSVTKATEDAGKRELLWTAGKSDSAGKPLWE